MTIRFQLGLLFAAAGLGLTSCNTGTKSAEEKTALAQPARLIPMRDFFKSPNISTILLSPSGEKVGFMLPYQNRMNIHVLKVGTTDTIRLTEEKDRDIQNYFWKTDNVIIFQNDKGGNENFHLFSVKLDTREVKELTPFPNARAEVVDELPDDEQHMLITMNKENPENMDVYKINVVTGKMELVAKNPGGVQGWVTDHTGEIRMAVQTDGVNSKILYRDHAKMPFKVMKETSFKDQLNPLFFDFDNKLVYASSNLGRDKMAIVKIDPGQGGKEVQMLFEHPDVDVSNLSYSRKRKVLTSIEYTTAKNEHKFLDPEMEAMYGKIQAKLGTNLEVILTSHNRNEDKWMVRTLSDRSLGVSYIYDAAKDELTKVADRSPWIKEAEMAEMKPIEYTSKDGMTIHGYLTLPVGVEPKNLPVVINPHGGPWARDGWGFNNEVQFLANRGYAVLQINFRGSTGYGRKFWEASFKQWGQTMQQDITDGVNWLIGQGIADPKRVGIYGASYGGYATLAGLTLTPDLYACGVDYVGVSNMFTFMNTIPPYWKPLMDMFHEMVGDPKKDSVMLRSVSPVYQVDKIKAPLFIAQGANDPRVNKAESDQMVEALKKRNIEVEYMVKDNEGHGFHNEENKFEFYTAMEKFLALHLGGRKE